MALLNSPYRASMPKPNVVRQPCVAKCNGCRKMNPEGTCEVYENPAALWSGRACFFNRAVVAKEEKLTKNPLKASRRQRRKEAAKKERKQQAAQQQAATKKPVYDYQAAKQAARTEKKANKK